MSTQDRQQSFVRQAAAQETPGPGIDLPLDDPKAVSKVIQRVFDKVSAQLEQEDGEVDYADLIRAVRAVLGLRESSLDVRDQAVLVEFLGPQYAARLLVNQHQVRPLVESMITEDTPAIERSRANRLSYWFDLLMRQLRKSNINRKEVVRVGRRAGFELINALADRTIRT